LKNLIDKERLGRINNAIRLGSAYPEDLPPLIPFNSRFLITDIDGDGKKEIVAIKNIPLIGHLLNFKVFTKSNLIAHRIEGTSLFPAWATGEIDYCLTDMQAEGRRDKYNNGVALVGCGRCVRCCPVNIDIREVFSLMNEL